MTVCYREHNLIFDYPQASQPPEVPSKIELLLLLVVVLVLA